MRATSWGSMLLSAGILAVSISAPLFVAHGQVESSGPPNILLIITDDQRDGLDVMPSTAETFIEEGTSYPNAFVTTPLCCPSRSSIFTGRYVHNHGVYRNRDTGSLDQNTTIQHYLQQAGYRTALFGKYLNRWGLGTAPPSFDHYAVVDGGAYYDGTWNIDGTIIESNRYSTTFLGAHASSFLDQQAAEDPITPWFLVVSTTAPHSPYKPQPRYADAKVGSWERDQTAFDPTAREGKPDFLPDGGDLRDGKLVRRAQFRTLMSVDVMVESVFAKLTELGEADNTLAIFISDNGYMWGEFGLIGKGYPYSPSIKVPMMLRWPARLEPGVIDDRMVANIDLAPTILDAAGLTADPDTPMDGRSLLDSSWVRDRLLIEYWAHTAKFTPFASLRTPRQQYIEWYDATLGITTYRELYDLESDPWQTTNLFHSDPTQELSPTTADFATQLQADKLCRGTNPNDPFPCP